MSHTKQLLATLAIVFTLFSCSNVSAETSHRIGAGLHYWYALEDIDVDNIDDQGVALQLSYQYVMSGLFKIEADLDILEKGYSGSESTVFSPQVFFLVGKALYAGVGIGTNYSDGDFSKKPFYALRAGIELEFLPSLFLDINANYRFETWDMAAVKDDIDTDTVTLGAFVRLQF